MSGPSTPELFVHWERFLRWLLLRTARFPRRMRFTLTNRIDNHALDILEAIIEARYGVERVGALRRVNLTLEKLRLLLRLAHDQRILDTQSFEAACADLDTAGRMTGGWLRHAQGAS